ncbi:MAG: SUMF1/EgtB/PvdO family nonheme iron enzyme [Myxococcales bacterium]|nr:SUMF1/EgtB/PvdO family nonheme iron enzyme [Myxococcales bacterium]
MNSSLPAQGDIVCGRYHLTQLLGRGSMGVVYAAIDLALQRRRAIKLMLPERTGGTTLQGNPTLRAEAAALMGLSHPNIVRIFNFEQEDELELLVMEFLKGTNLHDHVRNLPERRMRPDSGLRVSLDCLAGLQNAHESGVVHNDLKPGNIMLCDDGVVKLCDFGLSGLTEHQGPQRKKLVIGTPAFISPERARGDTQPDPRSDLYSMGACMYALLSGAPPFGSHRDQAYEGHARQALPKSPFIGPQIHGFLVKSMSKRPKDRFESAAAMREALQTLLNRLDRDEANGSVVSGVRSELRSARRAQGARRSAKARDMVLVPPRTWGARPHPFLMDRTPITHAMYEVFVRETGASAPPGWIGKKAPWSRRDHPVCGLTHKQARAYAEWSGSRLPTLDEWLYACRGPYDTEFPWGDDYVATYCNGPNGPGATTPVRRHRRGATAEGVLDLVGNVWEWVDDPRDGSASLAVGGSFRSHPAGRDGLLATRTIEPGEPVDDVGFRCVRDAR